MEKRYQVFVSSTYADLQGERQEVMQALLELDSIPAGMELFPAANDDQWTLIKKVIDDCDYYIVILAGRYGSLGPGGMSFTELEYRYALEKSKPVIGFIHKAPGSLAADRCEPGEEGRQKLEEFRSFVKQKTCRFWDSPADLGSQVSRSLIKLIRSNPAVGWVKGDLVLDAEAAEEILRLRKQVDYLQAGLNAARTAAPAGTENLAQGEEAVDLRVLVEAKPPGEYAGEFDWRTVSMSWNSIFAAVSPLMIDEASEKDFRAAVLKATRRPVIRELKAMEGLQDYAFSVQQIADDNFQTVKVQLRALGLITKSARSRSVKDIGTYWTLTPYGDEVMTRLRAISRRSAASINTTEADD